MRGSSTFGTSLAGSGSRVVAIGIAAIVLILLVAAIFIFAKLPDANAFNERVEQIFVENDDLTAQA